ncbi:MAG: hypothetical protein IKN04_07285 [Clostridia bacterium]|nr:hypothetical protein [Clostridia bacterium]
MKKMIALLLVLLLASSAFTAMAEGISATLNQKITTRSGPSMDYDSTGTHLAETWQTERVMVLSKAKSDDAWWVLVEFSDNGEHYRLYTAATRVNVDLDAIPEETLLGEGEMIAAGDVPGHYGPSQEYAESENDVPWCVEVTVWGAEDGYLLVDFYDEDMQNSRRAWVYAELAEINWTGGAPGGAKTFNRADIPAGTVFSDDEGNSCAVMEYASVGENTVLSLTIRGKLVYPGLIVKMDGSDHGAFVTAEGDGEIWFSDDEIMIDAYLPDFGIADTMVLSLE